MFSKFMPDVFGLVPPFFCNIYIITIKQFSQLFFIDHNFVFVNKYYVAISYETLICKKMLDELRKALTDC